MEDFIKELKVLFEPKTVLYYLLGFVTFLATLIDDIFNPSKDERTTKERIHFYLTEFVYTALSIVFGVVIASIADLSKSLICVVAIIMGLIGATLFRKVLTKQDTIADSVVDKIIDETSDKISNNSEQL